MFNRQRPHLYYGGQSYTYWMYHLSPLHPSLNFTGGQRCGPFLKEHSIQYTVLAEMQSSNNEMYVNQVPAP
jgi:hypothetical protein